MSRPSPRKRRSIRQLEEMPGLFDAVDIDMTDADRSPATHHAPAASAPDDASIDLDPDVIKYPDNIRFISLGSGSSGNCAYLGNSRGGILIDAGVDNNMVTKALQDNGIDMTTIAGIILTHDHSDHVRFAYSLLRRNKGWLLFTTPRTLSGLLRRHNISRRISDYHKPVYKEFEFEAGGFTITPFETSHDGSDNVGFHIRYGNRAFVVATDMGYITERAEYYMRRCRYLMLEADYDTEMLRTGRYPEYLKARIAGPRGHLANTAAARFVASLFTAPAPETTAQTQPDTPSTAAETATITAEAGATAQTSEPIVRAELTHIFLCHLSEDNNTPETAVGSVRDALTAVGVTVGDATGSHEALQARVQLTALPRRIPSPLYILRP